MHNDIVVKTEEGVRHVHDRDMFEGNILYLYYDPETNTGIKVKVTSLELGYVTCLSDAYLYTLHKLNSNWRVMVEIDKKGVLRAEL